MRKREKTNTRITGEHYEKAAGRFLEEQGYRILEYNYRCRSAEIDIVAKDGEYLVFCEVKYRRSGSQAEALEAVNVKKQKQICRAALFYIGEHAPCVCDCRFDVVGICGKDGGTVTLIKNAFDYTI